MSRNTGHVLLPLLIVVLYLSAFRSRISSAIFSDPVITNIGGMCYSIYLFHFMIIYGVKHLTAPLHFGENFWFYYVLQSCLILPVVMLFCGIFFVLIERPCMDREWPWKLWHQAQMLLLSRAEQPQT
jgi:peptidoglycan/LPS O-acetylase OafA/YrhL